MLKPSPISRVAAPTIDLLLPWPLMARRRGVMLPFTFTWLTSGTLRLHSRAEGCAAVKKSQPPFEGRTPGT